MSCVVQLSVPLQRATAKIHSKLPKHAQTLQFTGQLKQQSEITTHKQTDHRNKTNLVI